MALYPESYQYISQLGVMRLIDATTGPDGPLGVTAYWLVPSGGWNNGQRFPHDVQADLEDQGFETRTFEGIEYFLVPEESSNLPGRLSHYAQLTGVAELQNPSGGGVNRVRETLEPTAAATVDPEGVEKFVSDNDSWEEARQKRSAEDETLAAAVNKSPAREPSESKLVEVEGGQPGPSSDPANAGSASRSNRPASDKPADAKGTPKSAPKTDSDKK